MADRITHLGPDALLQVQEVVRRELGRVQGGGLFGKANRASEGYTFIAKASTDGITARSGTTPGSGTAQLHYLSGGALAIGSTTFHTVNNFSTDAIAAETYLLLHQNTQGTLWAQQAASTSASAGGSTAAHLDVLWVGMAGTMTAATSDGTKVAEVNTGLGVFPNGTTNVNITFESSDWRVKFNGTHDWMILYEAFVYVTSGGAGEFDFRLQLQEAASSSVAFGDLTHGYARSRLDTLNTAVAVSGSMPYHSTANKRLRAVLTINSTTLHTYNAEYVRLLFKQLGQKG